jgi:hypothetical protein
MNGIHQHPSNRPQSLTKSLQLTLIYWHGSAGWKDEINGVLEFYIHTAEHPASEPVPPKPSGPP